MTMVRIVSDYLEYSFSKFPNKIAFSDNNRDMTFGVLRKEALGIAAYLIELGLNKKPVAIFLDKSVECIAAFMGVAYSGNFYSPLDTKMPIERLEKICSTFQPDIIITDKQNIAVAEKFSQGSRIVIYEDIVNTCVELEKVLAIGDKIIDTDIIYVLFTSGSTGVPKGVVVSHKALISYTEWVSDAFRINDSTIMGNQTPFYFSMSVLDVFQTIRNACTMYIIPKKLFSFPIKLLEFIKEKNINFIYWVPSALCLVANLKALEKRDVSCLRMILFAGEIMPAKQLNMWRKVLKHALFANLFGPTEVTDICSYYVCDRQIRDDESVPIGIACKNTDLIILDANDNAVLPNEKGELCVRGSCLAYGYYGNAERTKEAFVQNPLNKCYPEIIYRTGDIVHYNELNELIYDGRKDFQIKHMGHRIELGEIETVSYSISEVFQCCCLYDEKKSKIVLFYVGNITEKDIVDMLRDKIPDYMVPNKVVKMDSLPINLNGKIDRVVLKGFI